MEMGQITPGCYYDTASKWKQNLISTHDFFSKCLSHLGPTRVHHPEDANPLDKQLSPLFYKGEFGPVAAAIKLCESDILAGSVDVEGLVPLFVACTIESQTIESIRALDSQKVLASPLFRQALIVTALKRGHESLVRELISYTPATPPPPPETCVFKMRRLSSFMDDEGISVGLGTALVTTGWAPPSKMLMYLAVGAANGPDGVVLLNAIIAAGYNMHADLQYINAPLSMALVAGEPEVLEYLFNIYSITPTNDMLIQAIELRQKGGVGVLRLLLDKYKLDLNYVRQGRGPYDIDPEVGDPIERAERNYIQSQYGIKPIFRTALHAATIRGNIEASEFLLGRGALDYTGGGQ